MIPPGWNVTEPLQVAKEFVVFVREFRGAPQEIKVFASTLDGFSGALKQLDKRLRHPDLVPAEEYDGLKSAFIDCMHCAESCQNFINQFNQDVRVPVSAGHKLKWIWKKDQSLALERSMASKISIITMHLNVAAMGQRNPSVASDDTIDDSAESLPTNSHALTPCGLLGLHDRTNDEVQSSPAAPGDLSCSTPLECSRPSMTEYTASDSFPRKGSDASFSAITLDSTMDNLSGVSMRIESRRTRNPGESRPVQKVEVFKDIYGNSHYMIVTFAHQNDKSRYQTRSLSDNHPEILKLRLLQFIPHSEHPIAYDNRPKFRVKFLKHNLSPPLSSSSKSKRTESSATPSEKGVGSPLSYGSANTPLSSSMGSMGSSMTIGSPMLRGKHVNAAEETEHRDFEFKDEKDYKLFQEIVVGKELLFNAPIDSITSKSIGGSETRTESEFQYLRLWMSDHLQTMMYYANHSIPTGLYMEHNIEHFRPVDSKPSSNWLRLDVFQPESPTPKVSRQGSLTSVFSSPISFGKGSRKGKDVDESYREDHLPQNLRDLKYLIISFTNIKDKKLFLKLARFLGTSDSSALPHLPSQSRPP